MSKKLTDKQILAAAEKVYQKDGAAGVYGYANRIGIKLWEHCPECDAETPSVAGVCLCCGTTRIGVCPSCGTARMPKAELSDRFRTLMNSCAEGYNGTWDLTGEGRDGFVAMYEGLKKLAKNFGVKTGNFKKV